MSIDEGGANGLRSALDAKTFQRFEETCAASNPVGGRIDGPSGKVLQRGILGLLGSGGLPMIFALLYRFLSKRWENGKWKGWLWSWSEIHALDDMLTTVSTQLTPFRLPEAGDKHYQVDRRILRSILLASQEDSITYDSAIESYSITPDGVVAKFANGTTAIGSLLVGADGIKSKVAAQLIGDSAAPLDLCLRIIYGKTPLSADVERALHITLRKGISFVTDRTADGDKVTLVLETMRFPDPSATENYIFWALTTRKGGFLDDDQRLLALTGQQVADLSIDFTKHWDPSIRVVFEKQAVFETAVLRVSSSDPDHPPTWDANSRVTVLGDAIHCMPPTGGQGANAAMYDAALLGQILADSTRQETGGGGWDVETIGRYEEAMRYNIGDIVGLACVGAQHALGADTLEAMLAGVEGKKTQ